MLIRKFYNAEESGAGQKFEIAGELQLQDVFDNMNQPQPEKEVENQPEKQEEKVEEKKEVTGEQQKPEEKKEEVVEEVKKVEQPTINWKEEVLKDRKAAHEILGIDEDALKLSAELKADDFVNKLITYRKEHGNLTPFIEAATKDWDKVSHDQLIMDELKRQYSSLSPDKAEKLARSEFNQRFVYKDDPNLSEEENSEMAELTAIKLEAEGEKLRSSRKESQKQFLDSVKPVDRTLEIQAAEKAKADADKAEYDKFKAEVESNPATQKLFSEKKLVLGSKEKSFNYTVSPEVIKDQTLDTNNFFKMFWDDGKFNHEKWHRVSAYAQDPSLFEDSLINHGMSLGTGNVVEKELENVKEKNTNVQKVEKKSLAKTFVEEGQAVSMQDMFGM